MHRDKVNGDIGWEKIIRIGNGAANRRSLNERKWSYSIFDPAEKSVLEKLGFLPAR
jgi:hypothetical protein